MNNTRSKIPSPLLRCCKPSRNTLIYRVKEFASGTVDLNIRYFWLDLEAVIDGDVGPDILLVRPDGKFAFYQDKIYRVAELGIDEDADPPFFVKVWENDPFLGSEEHEQV